MNEKINLQDLSALLAEKAAITKKDAETFLREYFDLLNEELANSGSVKIKDLGTFKLLQVEDRESVDVTTGERVLIPAHYKVAFLPDKKLAETVNEPFAFFETVEMDGEVDSEESQPFIEEDASEESELSAEEEDEVVFEKTPEEEDEEKPTEEIPVFEEELPPVEEEPLTEKITENKEEEIPEEITDNKEEIPEENPTFSRETRAICLNCPDYEAHRVYRKKYFNIRKKLNIQRVIISILSLLLAAALGYIIYMTVFDKNILAPIFHKITTNFSSNQQVVPVDSIAPADNIALVDSIISADSIAPADSVNPIDSIVRAEESVKQDTVVKTVPPVNAVESKHITVSTGDRLSTIAQKEYGNKAFWIYIYLENKAIIRNPDILPVGITITIPPAAKYGIDCSDSVSIQKAKDTAARRP